MKLPMALLVDIGHILRTHYQSKGVDGSAPVKVIMCERERCEWREIFSAEQANTL